ncbi:SDR family NAD(P)-dependent oxidoreductase [Inquilinus limosus]|uniref:SDR family NAD(P)-dependent oxidoreductase n=1 Tax=Inquilinus limosus TaxID=171674 RepID=UPI00047A56EF|nr:SDR family oxidoreductase [Inquilinus limosus]
MVGKVVLVTEAASPIGRASALALALQGATVLAADRDPRGGVETAVMIRDAGGRVGFQCHDIGDEASWRNLVEAAWSGFGALHVLVNTVGVPVFGHHAGAAWTDLGRERASGLRALSLGLEHAIPAIARSGGGAVVNVALTDTHAGNPRFPYRPPGKGEITLLTKERALACVGARNGVRVNSVRPTAIDAPVIGATGSPPAAITRTSVWMGHSGTPQDIAEGVLFLASDDARYVTGTELIIDGRLNPPDARQRR